MHRIVWTVLLFALSLFCSSATSSPDGNHTDIRGRITEIRRASAEAEHRLIGTVMVEANDKDAKVDRANLIITDKTHIFKEHDGKRVQATFDELKVGQVVEAEFVEGPTVMIYPLRVAATEIVILNDGEQKNEPQPCGCPVMLH